MGVRARLGGPGGRDRARASWSAMMFVLGGDLRGAVVGRGDPRPQDRAGAGRAAYAEYDRLRPTARARSDADSQRTLVLVKPDGVARGLTGEVIRRVEAKGYRWSRSSCAPRRPSCSPSTTPSTRQAVLRAAASSSCCPGPVVADGRSRASGSSRGSARWPAPPTRPRPLPGHDPRRPRPRLGPGRAAEPRARLGLAGVRRPRDRALVPRALSSRSRGVRRVRECRVHVSTPAGVSSAANRRVARPTPQCTGSPSAGRAACHLPLTSPR